jgi:hypothetical protein
MRSRNANDARHFSGGVAVVLTGISLAVNRSDLDHVATRNLPKVVEVGSLAHSLFEITRMDDFGFETPLGKISRIDGNRSRAESLSVDLMGLRDTQVSALGQAKYKSVVTTMAPTFERWGSQWLKYGSVAGGLHAS